MSMSCSPRQDADRRRRPPPAAPAPALDLLDECWFFSNTLANNSSKPPLPRRSDKGREEGDSKLKASASAGPSRFHRRLLRTPSLPSPRVGMAMEMPKEDDDLVVEVERREDAAVSGSGNQQQLQKVDVEDEVDDDDLNWSSIYEGVLRSRMAEAGGGSRRPAALRRAPSMPVPSSATEHHHHHGHQTKPTPRTPSSGEQRRREVRSSSASQHHHQQQPPLLARSRSVFQDKKWGSSGDLESVEVQGFRDLGGVLPPRLKQAAAGSRSSRPHLPEAWQQRPAALVRVQSDARSTAAEMKDQLRMWAQAVACNVRQEC